MQPKWLFRWFGNSVSFLIYIELVIMSRRLWMIISFLQFHKETLNENLVLSPHWAPAAVNLRSLWHRLCHTDFVTQALCPHVRALPQLKLSAWGIITVWVLSNWKFLQDLHPAFAKAHYELTRMKGKNSLFGSLTGRWRIRRPIGVFEGSTIIRFFNMQFLC